MQSPGQYYYKPMMKEYRFEPASQMIEVEEGQILSIAITGFKTAYRYGGARRPYRNQLECLVGCCPQYSPPCPQLLWCGAVPERRCRAGRGGGSRGAG